MAATWTIECDEPMLEMPAFCAETVGQMLKEDLESDRKECMHGKKRTAACLRADITTASRLLAAAIKGQVNLEISKAAATARKKSKITSKKGKGAR